VPIPKGGGHPRARPRIPWRGLSRWALAAGELAAPRVPDLTVLREPEPDPTVAEAASRWQASRVDIAESTRVHARDGAQRALPHSALAAWTSSPRRTLPTSIRKTVTAVAMVCDHAGASTNPARDRVVVKVPRDDSEEPNSPTAEQVAKVYRLIPSKHRLALLFLDWSVLA
jgi:hypothetical protein